MRRTARLHSRWARWMETLSVDHRKEGLWSTMAFSPTVRSLMQLAAQHGLVLHRIDVKTAYLHVPIDCEVYMEQTEGFEAEAETRRVNLIDYRMV